MSRSAIFLKRACYRQSQVRKVHGSAGPSFRDIVARLGHMANNGIAIKSAPAVAQIMKVLSSDWRDLVAGVDGFLTKSERLHTSSKEIEWGHLVSI
jgi:hypothetical protein